jgi:ABC-2 type transport system permease protein
MCSAPIEALAFNVVLFAAAAFAFVNLLRSARVHGTLLQTGE